MKSKTEKPRWQAARPSAEQACVLPVPELPRAFFGGVPISSLYDNLKIAVARILGDGRRQRIAPSQSSQPLPI